MAKLSEEVKLRRSIRRIVESKKNYLDKQERANYRSVMWDFFEKFILCEIGTKRALKKYYQSIGQEKEVEDVNMQITDIEKALKAAGYDVESMNLNRMFKKNLKRGEKSARDLRNAIAHDLSSQDIEELVGRWDEIQDLLDAYISCLTSEPLE